MRLTAEEIRHMLGLLAEETVVRPTEAFPYRVSQKRTGYSDDLLVSKLQGKLSILLEAEAVLARKVR